MNERNLAPAGLPRWTKALGYGGLVPFLACGLVMLVVTEPDVRHVAGRVLVGYGAVILAFLGGVHWGLVLYGRPGKASGMLVIGVVPSLVAWATLLLQFETAVAVQVVTFGGFWLYEHRVLGAGVLPTEYLALRRWLTLIVCASLGLALMARTLVPAVH